MTPQRIAYVLNIFPKLSETFIAGELAELRRRGVEIKILSLLPPRDELQHEIIARAGLDKLVCYEPGKFSDIIREFKPQLLHAHFAREATAEARRLAEEHRLPFTFTAHGYDIRRKPPEDFFERAAAATALVTVSEANADFISKTFCVPRKRIHVIACGVDTETFCPSENPPREVPPVILCVARHVAVKNLAFLLDACAGLNRRGLKFRCVMIGDGPLHEELKAKRAELGLEKIVEMPGAMEQGAVRDWWRRASVGVLTSENEGMPVSLMEAAACGVPVVAPAVGGIPELVADGVTGLVTKPKDLQSMVAALERLLRDEALASQFGVAARRRAEEKFSVRHQVDQLLALWSGVLANPKPGRPVRVSDPFNAVTDAALPTVAAALDPDLAYKEFKRRLSRLSGADGKLKLKAIRVVRHKPGKRCIAEYDVRVRRPGAADENVTLIGKVRARRSGNEALRQLETIWDAGFDAQSADGISVPEPIGVISEFKMWFQRKVPGETASQLLQGEGGAALARRIAEAAHKLHRANLPTDRAHTMDDELRILRECAAKFAGLKPELAPRLERVMAASEKLGANITPIRSCGIHRDFYAAQVIVDGSRLCLIDFDLLCEGDPGLDIGNFIGHMIELSQRERGDADATRAQELALEDRFCELTGEAVRASVHAYTTLTLVRHVYLSTQFAERRHSTEAFLELCERRLGLR